MSQKQIPIIFDLSVFKKMRFNQIKTNLSVTEQVRQAVDEYLKNPDYCKDAFSVTEQKRTLIILTSEQHLKLKQLAAESDISIAEHVRRAVDLYLIKIKDR